MTTASESLQTVQAVYEAFGCGDLDGLLGHVHPEVAWCQTVAGANHPVLAAGRGVGHDAVKAYFGAVAQHMAITRFVPLQLAANDDGYVFGLIDIEFADPSVGKSVGLHEVHVFKVVDGKIASYEPIMDTAKSAVAFAV